MDSRQFVSRGEVDTMRIGRMLAELLPEGSVVCLNGTLGSGKTRLVQAIAKAVGVPQEQVVSPTFTICNEYRGDREISHWDWYRVRDEDELAELGMDEYYVSGGLTLIEWANRFQATLPDERLEITLEVVDETTRRITLRGHGDSMQATLNAWRL